MFLACTCFRFWFQMYLVSVNSLISNAFGSCELEIWMGMVDLIWDSFGFVVCAALLLWFFFLRKTILFFNWLGFNFFFFFWVGQRIGPIPLMGPTGPGRGESGPWEKNPLSKWAGSGPRVLARRSSPGMEKPGPNPTCCHSYWQSHYVAHFQSLWDQSLEQVGKYDH